MRAMISSLRFWKFEFVEIHICVLFHGTWDQTMLNGVEIQYLTVESEVDGSVILSDILHNVATESCQVYCYLSPLTSGILCLVWTSGFLVKQNPPFLVWIICSKFFSLFFLLIAFAWSSSHRMLLYLFFEELCATSSCSTREIFVGHGQVASQFCFWWSHHDPLIQG